MKMRLLSIVLVACGVFLSAELSGPVEQHGATIQTDFDALHEQANFALQNLRQSRERRMASAGTVAF